MIVAQVYNGCMNYPAIQKNDPKVYEILKREEQRQKKG